MAKLQVEFEVEVPGDVSHSELRDWLRFELGEVAMLRGDNPLADTDIQAEYGTVSFRRLP